MLSGELNRLVNLKRKLQSAAIIVNTTDAEDLPDDQTVPAGSTGLINKKIKIAAITPTPFRAATDILINDDKVEVTLPTQTKGRLWDTWKPDVKEYPNNAAGFQQFVSDLTRLGVSLDNRIDETDSGINNIQTFTTAVTTIIQILQTSLAASQSLSGSSYTDYQMILSTVMAGLTLIAKYISTEVTTSKTNSINLKVIVTGLEDSQNLVPSSAPQVIHPTPQALAAAQPKADSKTADAKIAIDAAATTSPTQAPGNFVPVAGALVINNTEVDVTLPVQGSGCYLKPWKKELEKYQNTAADYKKLLKDLYTLQVTLSNASSACDNVNQFIQSISSFGTAIIGIIQTAVVGSSIGSTGLQIFQITISALNAAASVAAKVANNAVTDLRNETLTFSGDATELLVAQLKR
jgi:hypothetical protein